MQTLQNYEFLSTEVLFPYYHNAAAAFRQIPQPVFILHCSFDHAFKTMTRALARRCNGMLKVLGMTTLI